MTEEKLESKRWGIALAAIAMQLCIGTVYAWSVYKKPLMATHGWSETATQVAFMLINLFIGVATAFGGALVDKKGPRFVATIGGILFGAGTIIAGLADRIGSLPLLYFGYGIVAGLGGGMAYVTPIATLIRWFPDKRGLVTGLAVMGMGAGAFFVGQIAPGMVNRMGVETTLYIWGFICLIGVAGSAQMYRNPPANWLPAGFAPPAKTVSAAESFTFNEAIRTPQWWSLWSILFLNVSAGLGLISQLSPMAQEVLKTATPDILPAELAVKGGVILSFAAICNGLGRPIWAGISDKIGRRNVFLTMFVTQIILYLALPGIGNAALFTAAACYLLACYGGGFATMPAFAADSFGPGNIGKIYGYMLTAWGAAGIAGPLVFARFPGHALKIAAGLLVGGLTLSLTYRRPSSPR